MKKSEQEMQVQRPAPRGREQMSAIRRYRIGWVILGMMVSAAAVVWAGGGVAAVILLPLIVGAFIFRSALVEDYRNRQAQESQEN